ncbi:MAG: universal stress protein [Anaerolineaceae bacterium]|nr:universal stress protein [Anaerolineaceae bacterium]
MFNRILVPLDGSTLAERAIPHAEQFARIFGSSIILLQVLDPTSYHENPKPVDPLSWQIRKTEADMYMSGVAKRIRQDLRENKTDGKTAPNRVRTEKKSRVEYFIREGKPADNIVNFAQTEEIDLLVISTHGSGGLTRWNISSVTQKVVNLVYLPVLIVRAYNQPETEDAHIHYRRILLPIDCSRRAECALAAGIALASGELAMKQAAKPEPIAPLPSAPVPVPVQTTLVLAAVLKRPELPFSEPFPVEIEQIAEQLMQISRQAVNNYIIEMKERLPVPCETFVLENNSVATAIQELANQEEDIDLVVLCAHGYTGQFTWPYGSVARNYIEHGTKPVLVIQDVRRSQVPPTAAELAAEKTGGR